MFTYDETLPSPKDRIRLSLGDTDGLDPLLSDETILSALDQYAGLGDLAEPATTAFLARSLAARFGRIPSSMTIPGGPSLTYGDRVKSWLELASKLEAVIGGPGGLGAGASETPYFGAEARRSFAEVPEPLYDPYIGDEYSAERREWQT
jgi:hypothetical protein